MRPPRPGRNPRSGPRPAETGRRPPRPGVLGLAGRWYEENEVNEERYSGPRPTAGFLVYLVSFVPPGPDPRVWSAPLPGERRRTAARPRPGVRRPGAPAAARGPGRVGSGYRPGRTNPPPPRVMSAGPNT